MTNLKVSAYLALLCTLLFLVGCSTNSVKKSSAATSTSRATTAAQGAFERRLQDLSPAVWVVPNSLYEENIFLSKLKSQLMSSLYSHSGIDMVTDLKKAYQTDVCVGVMVKPGQNRYLNDKSDCKVLVAAYPLEARLQGGVPSTIAYIRQPPNYNRSFIIVPGYETTDRSWFDARFLHELYHQHQDETNQPGATANPESDEWNLEEVRAHELASQVLNQGTNGRYYQAISAVIEKRNYTDVNKIREQITYEDLKAIDQVFQPGSKEELHNRTPQYFLDIAFAIIKKNYSGAEADRRKILVYRDRHNL